MQITTKDNHRNVPLWTGPSTLITIRTSKNLPFHSLLKPAYKEITGIGKTQRQGLVPLGRLGFDGDEHALSVHGGPQKAVLQYNPAHYDDWKTQLKGMWVEKESRRNSLLDLGGFGENIAVKDPADRPPMDETTVCIGDLVAFRTKDLGDKGSECARMRVTGPRLPCFKLNHRFGVPDMSQRAQDKSWTGWLYSIEKEGDVKAGNEVVLLERPFPGWPVSRILYYLFSEPRNLKMIKEALDTLGGYLVYDVRETFENRLAKGTEDMSLRLRGEQAKDIFADFRLRDRRRETQRVAEFTFERVHKLAEDSQNFMVAESGSHIRLRFRLKGQNVVRPYSVISGNSNTFNLGIALADDSRGGSAFLHQTLQVGDVIEVSEKFANTFALQSEDVDHHVFLAGGIGITALLDHIRHCLRTGQSFHLHYLIRNKTDCAFQDLLERMLAESKCDRAGLSVYISAEGQRCNIRDLLVPVASENRTHMYICGSEKMADAVRQNAASLQLPNSRLHFEQFSVDSSGDPFVAELSQSRRKVQVFSEQSLLDALREAGLDIASSCEAGNCATCRVRVKSGRIVHRGTGLLEDEKAGANKREEGDMLSCVSRGVGSICLDL